MMFVVTTVDGRNSANQLRLVIYPIIYRGFIHRRWLFGISEPSTVLLGKGHRPEKSVLYATF